MQGLRTPPGQIPEETNWQPLGACLLCGRVWCCRSLLQRSLSVGERGGAGGERSKDNAQGDARTALRSPQTLTCSYTREVGCACGLPRFSNLRAAQAVDGSTSWRWSANRRRTTLPTLARRRWRTTIVESRMLENLFNFFRKPLQGRKR